MSGTYAWQDDYNFDALGLTTQDAYGVVNASIGYRSPDEKLRVSLWGNNLTDEDYFAIANINVLGTFGNFAPPRTYGVTLSYDFL